MESVTKNIVYFIISKLCDTPVMSVQRMSNMYFFPETHSLAHHWADVALALGMGKNNEDVRVWKLMSI